MEVATGLFEKQKEMTEEKDIPRFCHICQQEADWKVKGTPFYVCNKCKGKYCTKDAEFILIRALKETGTYPFL